MNSLKIAFLLFSLILLNPCHAQEVFSIITHPGEDASCEANVSWGSSAKGTYVLYTTLKDTANFRKAHQVAPLQEELCTTYDSIYSKATNGENIYEYPHFIKCGAILKGLKKNTEYAYYICCKNASNKEQRLSSLHKFKTAGNAQWSATIISDFHSYTPLGHRLKDAMSMLDRTLQFDPSTDWILHIGDVVAWGGSYSFWKTMYADPHFAQYSWTGLNGNHDNMTRKNGQSGNFFRDANYVPRNGYASQEGICYSFKYNDALFVMLNNEVMFKEEQLQKAQEWVKSVITKARQSSHAPRYVIVCEHYQWFYGETGRTSQYARWHNLFDELGVDLAISGNNHIYARTNAVYQGQNTDGTKGTVYLQTSSSDNERGQNVKEWTDNKDLIQYRWTEGPKTVSAINMKVNKKCIVLTLLNREGKIMDAVTVQAKKRSK